MSLRSKSQPRVPSSKLLSWQKLLAVRLQCHDAPQRMVWTNGCFDILHAGHISNLHAARELGDMLVVGVNSDRSVRMLKGPNRPVVSEHERALMVAALECVDYVVVLDTLSWDEQLAELQPHVYCKGAEYASDDATRSPERAAVEANGGRVVYLPMVAKVSTTSLISRILQRGRVAS